MKKTPLYNEHISLNAKMVDFGGYIMPIQYKGISIEHNCVRNDVGIFDVSHMGEFIVEGKESLIFLENICSNDIGKINVGNAQYNCFTNHNGGIVDDLIVYRLNDNKYMLVVNAANINKDWDWIKENHKNYNCVLKNISDNTGLISVQGPKSIDLISKIFNERIGTIKKFLFKNIIFDNNDLIISNTGYTGSLGFELYAENELIPTLWKELLDKGSEFNVNPIGLGARDTLRMEMGYCLYGNDIDDITTPFEANLMWITNLDKDFIGREKVLNSIKNSSKRMINFKMIDRGIPRSGYEIIDDEGNNIGHVTSGTFSPTNKTGIGIGYINNGYKIGEYIFILIRDKSVKAEIIKLPIING